MRGTLIVVACLLMSCQMERPGVEQYSWEVEDALHFVTHFIRYEAEPYGEDVWQTPYVTLKRKAGDCEDKAILFLWLVGRGELVLLTTNHAIVCVDGEYYDTTYGFPMTERVKELILWTVPFDVVEDKYF